MDFLGFRWLSLVALCGLVALLGGYVAWGVLVGRQRRDPDDPDSPEEL